MVAVWGKAWLPLSLLSAVLVGLCQGCPDECSCFDRESRTGHWHKIVDCSNRSLDIMPYLGSLTGQHIHELLLNDNEITRVLSMAFSGLRIGKLDLSHNNLRSTSDKAFDGIRGLDELVMVDCQLSSISRSFGHLTGLKKLDLHDNTISAFATSSIERMTDLEEIYLQNNQLQLSSPFIAFDRMHRVKILDMSNNRIVNLPNAFGQFVNLTHMNLSNNNIQALDTDITRQLTKLRKLDLENNPINFQRSHLVFEPLVKLEVLRVRGCTRRHLTTEFISALVNLRELIFADCSVHILDPGVFSGMKFLRHLDLGGNHMILKRSDFEGITDTVETLKMDNGNYTQYPTSIFQPFKVLRHIFMNGNEISSLHAGSFEGMNQADVHIHMEDNLISYIPGGVLRGTRRPISLYISGNPLPNLNFLTHAPCRFQLATINVTGFEVDCTCEFLRVLQQKSFTLIGTCSSPPEREGLRLDWRPGMTPESAFFEPNMTDSCPMANRRHKRYECTCESWLPHDSTHTCGVVGGKPPLGINLILLVLSHLFLILMGPVLLGNL